MRTTAILWVIALTAAGVCAQPGGGPSGELSAEGRKLAAESLRHSAAELIQADSDARSRAARLVALAEHAERLEPDAPGTLSLLLDIDQAQGRSDSAALVAGELLQTRPDDYLLGMRYLALRLDALQQADQRVQMLRSLAADDSYPPPLRAGALAQAGRILMGQGQSQDAAGAFADALQLDPYNAEALTGRLDVADDPPPGLHARTLAGLLGGNPLAVEPAWNLADLAGAHGLNERAMELFSYAEQIATRREGAEAPRELLVHYFNALLNVGRAEQAVEDVGGWIADSPDDISGHALLVEAYRKLERAQQADEHVQAMRGRYRSLRTAGTADAETWAEMAWFELEIGKNPSAALEYARRAAEAQSDSPVVQRVLGAAELQSDDVTVSAQGRRRLEELLGADAYASVYLAEHYYELGLNETAREALLAAADLDRGGPAWRRLASLAAEHGVILPPSPAAQSVAAAIDDIDEARLKMGRSPGSFLSVELRPSGEPPITGEPVELTVTLSNIGSAAVPLGKWGLASPAMALVVTLGEERFADLPMAVWAAPRDLPAGESVTTTVRVDIGETGRALDSRAVRDVELTVSGVLDPIERRAGFATALPSVKIVPVKVTRRGLLAPAFLTRLGHAVPEAQAEALNLALALIARHDLVRGDLSDRVRAVRQVGALLKTDQAVSAGEHPVGLAEVEPEVVRLIVERALGDRSPAVRAAMLVALDGVTLDRELIARLAGVIEDPSPLVRFRMAELIGASDSPGRMTLLNRYAEDSDPLVRQMAAAFLPR